MSRFRLAPEPRHLPPRLIFDVRQNRTIMNRKPNLPSGTFHVTDDRQAQELILYLGLLPHLEKESRLSEKNGTRKNAVCAAIGYHDTHWIIVSKISGFNDPKENGFTVVGMPKKTTSREEFLEKGALLSAAMFGSPDNARLSMIDTKPEN